MYDIVYVFVVEKINVIPSNEYVHFWFILSNHDLSKSIIILIAIGGLQLVGITTGHYMSAQDK